MVTRRLTVAVAFVVSTAVASGASQLAQQPPTQTSGTEAAVRPGSGITSPTLLRMVAPSYPSAEAAQITGTVELEAVVGVDGTVTDIRVVKSLNKTFGLDDAAVSAARSWLFRPGTRDGKPVRVIVTLILGFGADGPGSSVRQAEELIWRNATADDAPGLVKPVLLKSVEAKYTVDAMRAKIQGVVEVDIVVLPDGTVGAARIATSLDKVFGLDAEALAAARGWLFTVGRLNQKPVSVVTRISVPFRIR